MYEAFVKETKIDLKKLFDTDKVGNHYLILQIVILYKRLDMKIAIVTSLNRKLYDYYAHRFYKTYN